MKKILCLAVLAMTLSAPALATSDHEVCEAVGQMAQQDLRMAKQGFNTYQSLANNPERMMEYGFNNSVLFLVIAQTMWENRDTYTPAKAYKTGYKLCLELK